MKFVTYNKIIMSFIMFKVEYFVIKKLFYFNSFGKLPPYQNNNNNNNNSRTGIGFIL